MKRATVRDLRYAFPKVEAELAEGEQIEIVKRGKVIARLVPVEKPAPPKRTAEFYRDRLKQIFGDRVMDITGAEIIRQDRDGEEC